jgi:hypothetical protein
MQKGRTALSIATLSALAAALAGCGGSDESYKTLTGSTNKGAVYGAPVTIYNGSTGAAINSGTTDANNGTINISIPASVTGPVIVKVDLNTGIKYFDEKAPTVPKSTVAEADKTCMLAVLPSPPANLAYSVTAFTHVAAKLAGLNCNSTSFQVTKDKAIEGAAKTVLALGLPTNFNILAPAPPVTQFPLPTTYTNAYGKVLAQMAASSASSTALAQLKDFNDAITVSAGTATITSAGFTTLGTLSTVISSAITTQGVSNIYPTIQPTTVLSGTDLAAAITAQTAVLTSGTPTGATGASN